jgi:hypothetical protein
VIFEITWNKKLKSIEKETIKREIITHSLSLVIDSVGGYSSMQSIKTNNSTAVKIRPGHMQHAHTEC